MLTKLIKSDFLKKKIQNFLRKLKKQNILNIVLEKLRKTPFKFVSYIVKSRFGKVSQMIYFLSSCFKLFTSLIDKY